MGLIWQLSVGEVGTLVSKSLPIDPLHRAGHNLQQQPGRLVFSLNDGEQLRPRDECLHARQKLLPAGGLLLGGKLGLCKAGLMGHGPSLDNPLRLVAKGN